MKNSIPKIPVVIVGGGPVGLFLAIVLTKKGISCRVLEKRKDPVPDSRSLGIHPVSLELFDELGITDPFLEKGLKIKKGLAFTETEKLGEIDFEDCPKPHNYILACPQFATERILRDELRKLDEHSLVAGAEFAGFEESKDAVLTSFLLNGESKKIQSRYLIGCDGKNSSVRQTASIHYSGNRYPDTYIMGDFEDNTDFGSDAAVFLPKKGLIECFPLPDGMRRWVVKTDSYIPEPDDELLASLISSRIGYNISGLNNKMISSFGVQHFMAEQFTKGRILLAGDAAHVVSPIGGQGMNLGWLGAWKLGSILADSPKNIDAYSTYLRKVTAKVARRAEVNMRLGRSTSFPFFKSLFLKGILQSPLRQKAAEIFTMHGLEKWWF